MRSPTKVVSIAASVLLLSLVAYPPRASSAEKADAIEMPRYEVKQDRGYFDYDFRYTKETELMEEMKLTWISPAAHKNSLRVGDRLLSIDGTSVTELRYRDFIARMERELKAGDSRILVFTRKGLFRRLTITHTTKAALKEPNKALEPTSTAVTAPAAQEPRQP